MKNSLMAGEWILMFRWGDSRSPAFGDIDGYGTSLKFSISECLLAWGSPESLNDIFLIFQKFVCGAISCLPWCDSMLQSESEIIQSNLSTLNGLGILTINSQPAVDGVFSSDPTYGWGPTNGLIFQKCYIECFMSPEMLDLVIARIGDYPFITFFGVNSDVTILLTVGRPVYKFKD
jgi:methylenetetrahydrofolate reductase (NADPH)